MGRRRTSLWQLELRRQASRAGVTIALFLVACAPGKSPGGISANANGAPALTDEQRAKLATLELVNSAPKPDVTNAFADNAVAAAFGQKLFFYRGFAGPLLDSDNDGGAESLGTQGQTGRVACASCHLPESAFSDTRSRGKQISLASGWVLRRTPSLLDVGQRRLLTWIAKSDGFHNQAFGPLESDVEMNTSRLFVAQEVKRAFSEDYENIFGALPPLDDAARFPVLPPERAGCSALPSPLVTPTCYGRPGDQAEFDGMTPEDQDAVTRVVSNLGKALGAYLRKLTCGPSRFDAWLQGQADALTPAEQRGAGVFVSAGRCIDCHSGPFLSDFDFHNVGLKPGVVAVAFVDENDEGASRGLSQLLESPLNSRGPFSDGDDSRLPQAIEPRMLGAFATPTLRCVASRPSFMHTGQFRTLDDVIGFFTAGGNTSGYPGTNELMRLGLSVADRADLVAFLQALDGPGPSAELLVAP